MSKATYNNNSNIGIAGALFLIFLVLKLTDTIDWSWWWVTAPLWISVAIFFVIVGGVMLFVRLDK